MLSFLIATANAKSLPAISVSPITNDLSDRLAADKDFQNFTMSVYCFLENIKTSDCAGLFKKYFSKELTIQEKEDFIFRSGFVTEEEFINTCKEIYSQKVAITTKFPELLIPDNESTVKVAALKVASNKLQNIKLRTLDCWTLFCAGVLACNINCAIYYPDNYYQCWEGCFNVVSASWGLCQLFE